MNKKIVKMSVSEIEMREFLLGFAKGAKIVCFEEADSHWAAFSRSLTNKERLVIEAGGKQSGEKYGYQYRQF